MKVYTPADLAELFQVPEENILRWRLQHGWPSFKVGNKVRFTEAHLEQIIADHTEKPAPVEAADATPAGVTALPGQTARSAARKRTAS